MTSEARVAGPASGRRVFITGSPGAGKTTLAHRLGAEMALAVIEMDRSPGLPANFDLDWPWIVEGVQV
jgi:MoxR-like ATPase